MTGYMVFKGDDFYPLGGWDDLIGKVDTEDEARALASDLLASQWSHVVKEWDYSLVARFYRSREGTVVVEEEVTA